jgi:hypothetical protein
MKRPARDRPLLTLPAEVASCHEADQRVTSALRQARLAPLSPLGVLWVRRGPIAPMAAPR